MLYHDEIFFLKQLYLFSKYLDLDGTYEQCLLKRNIPNLDTKLLLQKK